MIKYFMREIKEVVINTNEQYTIRYLTESSIEDIYFLMLKNYEYKLVTGKELPLEINRDIKDKYIKLFNK